MVNKNAVKSALANQQEGLRNALRGVPSIAPNTSALWVNL